MTNGTNGTNGTGVKNGTNGTNGTSHPHQVSASFNYTKDVDRPTELYFYESPAAANIHEPGDDSHVMTVTDGWNRASSFCLDKEGFSVHSFHSSFSSWDNDDAVKTSFYPEVVDFLKSTTGAARILVFDHTIRTKQNEAKKLTDEKATSQRAPVRLVHCDYTAESGPLRVKQLLGSEADDLLSRRVSFINFWLPVRNTVEEWPLAMCDVTSSPADDFFKLYLRYRERTGENYVMRHSDEHKWWYFPGMTPEQVILLKTYESESDGRARFVGHTAFEDPETKEGARTRESVEVRTIAFY